VPRRGGICTFLTRKKSLFPLVFLKFVAHVGCFPKVLVADRAGKILSKRLGSLLSAKLVKLTPVATDEHFRNGGAKKAVQDIDYMTTCLMADRGLPKECWDVVGEHASLLNACHYPCPSNPSITIYECETGEVKFLISMQFQRLAALQCVI